MTFVQIEERGRTPVLTLDLRLDASVEGAKEHHPEEDFCITDFSRNCFGFV